MKKLYNEKMNGQKLIVFFIFYCSLSYSEPFVHRNNYNQLLEIKDKIITGAGQDDDAFSNYWYLAMDSGHQPVIYMYYIGLKNLDSTWSDGLKEKLDHYPGFVIPQIGLSMTQDGTPSEHYEQDVVAGLYDQEISNLVKGFRRLARPAFIRIGYEFNGYWNGYESGTYRQAYWIITDSLRANNLEVATVWAYALDGTNTFYSYYPGHNYVDWFGIDIFKKEGMTETDTEDFMNFAHVAGKPVMIGETTSKWYSTSSGQASYDVWFAQYFSFIHSHPGIKALCYINWNWNANPDSPWYGWGDCRIEINEYVRQHYNGEMDSALYFHVSSEQMFREQLSCYNDTIAPVAGHFSITEDAGHYRLTWGKATDSGSGLAGYRISNGYRTYYTTDTFLTDDTYFAGDTLQYTGYVIDRAGNISMMDTLRYILPMVVNKLRNSEFMHDGANWYLYRSCGLTASGNIDTTSQLSGSQSYQINVGTAGTPWCVQLLQPVQVKTGYHYYLSLQAKADDTVDVYLVFEINHSPYSKMIYQQVTLMSQPQTFVFDAGVAGWTDEMKVDFQLASVAGREYHFDSIFLMEYHPLFALPENTAAQNADGYKGVRVFPNPASGLLNVEFSTETSSVVSFSLFSISGSMVYQWEGGSFNSGKHIVQISIPGVSQGLYFLNISYDKVCRAVMPVAVIR